MHQESIGPDTTPWSQYGCICLTFEHNMDQECVKVLEEYNMRGLMLCKGLCSRCRLAQIRPTHRSRLNFHKSFFTTCASLIAHYHVTYHYSAVQDISCFKMEAIFFSTFITQLKKHSLYIFFLLFSNHSSP